MDRSNEDVRKLSEVIRKILTGSVDVRRIAERSLENYRARNDYAELLILLINEIDFGENIRVMGANMLLNYVKTNWQFEYGHGPIYPYYRNIIKMSLVNLIIRNPVETIHQDLLQTLEFIRKRDFPNNWEGLLHDLARGLQAANIYEINRVVRTSHTIFGRYQNTSDQALLDKIRIVLPVIKQPLIASFSRTMQLFKTCENYEQLVHVRTLLNICRIFYSLSFQVSPRYCHDEMKTWIEHFVTLLSNDFPTLQDSRCLEVMAMMKSQIVVIVRLYTTKYDFTKYLPDVVPHLNGLLISNEEYYDKWHTDVVNLLLQLESDPKYEHLIKANLPFKISDETADAATTYSVFLICAIMVSFLGLLLWIWNSQL